MADFAPEAQRVQVKERPFAPSSLEPFKHALGKAEGAAGLDGWHRAKLAALSRFTPWLVEELYELLVATTVAARAGLPKEVAGSLYGWRALGVPKRGTDEARPIAVGAVVVVVVRFWHKCLLDSLTLLPEERRRGAEVLGMEKDSLNWLAVDACSGAELDLAKAFDSVRRGGRLTLDQMDDALVVPCWGGAGDTNCPILWPAAQGSGQFQCAGAGASSLAQTG